MIIAQYLDRVSVVNAIFDMFDVIPTHQRIPFAEVDCTPKTTTKFDHAVVRRNTSNWKSGLMISTRILDVRPQASLKINARSATTVRVFANGPCDVHVHSPDATNLVFNTSRPYANVTVNSTNPVNMLILGEWGLQLRESNVSGAVVVSPNYYDYKSTARLSLPFTGGDVRLTINPAFCRGSPVSHYAGPSMLFVQGEFDEIEELLTFVLRTVFNDKVPHFNHVVISCTAGQNITADHLQLAAFVGASVHHRIQVVAEKADTFIALPGGAPSAFNSALDMVHEAIGLLGDFHQ